MKYWIAFQMLFAISVCLPAWGGNVEVVHDGRFIYYRSSWVHLSNDEQVQVIDESVSLLKSEISTVVSQIKGLKTLSNFILSSGPGLDLCL